MNMKLLLIAVLGVISAAADAQVPPHAPGSICFTPKFWCWAQPPGPPGTSCSCATKWGWVPGTRG